MALLDITHRQTHTQAYMHTHAVYGEIGANTHAHREAIGQCKHFHSNPIMSNSTEHTHTYTPRLPNLKR